VTSVDDPHVVIYQDQLVWPKVEDFGQWTVTRSPGGQPRKASGRCPYCGHNLVDVELHYRALGRGQAGVAQPPAEERFTALIICDCGRDHPDAATPPVSHPSCGRKWLASVTVSPTTPGPEIRPEEDETLRRAAMAWNEFVAAQEPTFRALADKWTSAITVLLGLFGLAVFVTSKDAFTGLPFCSKILAALAVIIALLCGVRAVYLSYRAAYGWPEVTEVKNNQELLEWHSRRSERLEQSANNMKCAVRLAIGALGFLVVAACLMWLVPRHSENPPFVPFECRITATATPSTGSIYDIGARSDCAAANAAH
jgi:hypothetical protein